MSKRTRLVIMVTIIGLLAIGAAVFFSLRPQSTTPTPQTTPQTEQPVQVTPPSESHTPALPVSYPVKVFFSKHPESDDDPSKVFPVSRISPDLGVAKYVIQQLLIGPTAQEAARGYFSTVRVRDDASNCGGADFTISIKNSVATLQFCRTFDALGSVADGQAKETINASLLQFSSITKTIILTKNGDCQFDMSGLNLCLQ